MAQSGYKRQVVCCSTAAGVMLGPYWVNAGGCGCLWVWRAGTMESPERSARHLQKVVGILRTTDVHCLDDMPAGHQTLHTSEGDLPHLRARNTCVEFCLPFNLCYSAGSQLQVPWMLLTSHNAAGFSACLRIGRTPASELRLPWRCCSSSQGWQGCELVGSKIFKSRKP